MLVKGIGCSQRDAEDAHDQVNKGQVADEEVGRAVSFLVVPNEEEQQEISGAGDQNHSRVEREKNKLQVVQEVQASEGWD